MSRTRFFVVVALTALTVFLGRMGWRWAGEIAKSAISQQAPGRLQLVLDEQDVGLVRAGIPLAVSALVHGRPAVWWLCLAAAVALAAHAARPPGTSLRSLLLTNLRNAAISAGSGVACVVAMQLVLHHVGEHQIGRRALRLLEGGVTVRDGDDFIVWPQYVADILPHVRIVIGEEYAGPLFRVGGV